MIWALNDSHAITQIVPHSIWVMHYMMQVLAVQALRGTAPGVLFSRPTTAWRTPCE